MVPQVLDNVTVQMFCGSGDLSATAVQRPGAAFRLQAMQAVVHALSQHAPWAQNPDWHSVPLPHLAPHGLRPHEASTQ